MDDDQDKGLMKNQILGIVLMTVLIFIWLNYFAPRRAPVEPEPEQPETQTTSVPTDEEPETTEETQEPAGEPSAEWPYLPPVPETVEPSDEIVLENGELRLVFTAIGGRLKRAEVVLDSASDDVVQLVPEAVEPDTHAVYPLGLWFPAQEELGKKLNYRRFDAELDASGHAVTFTLATPALTVTKSFALTDTPFVVESSVRIENREESGRRLGRDQTPAYLLGWAPDVDSPDKTKGGQSIVMRHDNRNDYQDTRKLEAENPINWVHNAEWIGVKSAYFVVALKPDIAGESEAEPTRAFYDGAPENFRIGLAVPRMEIPANAADAQAFRVYVGPSKLETLAAAWPTLDSAPRFFQSDTWAFMDKFAKLLLRLLNWFHSWGLNYGWAIIALTVLVRGAMLPLTLKSMKSMKKMQQLAPEIEKLREKYKEDQQELNKRMMELYRERGVNPVGGCLPLLLQMPIFIGLFRMLRSAYELRGAPFMLWINDLSQPDHLFHMPYMTTLPFVGEYLEYFNLLPILMALSMLVSQKVLPQSGAAANPQQKTMMTIMPIFFGVICYSMASGLSLYILVSTVLGIVQQAITRMQKDVDITPKKKKAPRKRQHFYKAAQERKRRIAKETKTEARRSRTNRPASVEKQAKDAPKTDGS
ncbi:MAG: membrane protein insertase YidC [Candidatus Hydrogenedentota bacterium]